MKKTFIILLSFLMLAPFIPNKSYAADDITGHGLELEMREVVELGIMRGYSEGVYGPDRSVTRAEFATFLARALNLPSPPAGQSIFKDVPPDKGLADGIYRAAAAGIVGGYPGDIFKPNQEITREQMAVMIDRSLEYKMIDRTPVFLSFTDVVEIAPMFQPAVSHNVYFGIILGSPVGNGKYRFSPKQNATRAHAAAFISRMLNVINSQGEITVKYQIATISDGQVLLDPRQYLSYSDALQNIENPETQVIYHGQQVVKMNDGIVVATPSPGKFTTIIYDQALRVNLTYVSKGSTLKYLGADENKVKVQIANTDTVGYVKPTEVSLVPTELVANQSYYEVINGELRHVIYNPLTNKSVGAYTYGPAPKAMKNGETYSSWNGIDFVGVNNNNEVSYTQYFNYLPLYTTSNYTAEDLNTYAINERPDSPLTELGHVFIQAQEQYGVNALYLFAKAIHESNWATSEIAKTKNNLFGLNATDTNPEGNADQFETMEASIMYAAKFLSTTYFSYGNWRYQGAVLGNKSHGLNVFYASDPYWGRKIAGHMNRIDKFHGRKDYNKYEIGVTTVPGLNVRHQTVISPVTLQFTYPKAGYYVAILEETSQPDGIWYKIISDHPDYQEAYVHSDYVKKLSFE